MSTAIQQLSQNALSVALGISDLQLQTLRSTYAKNATDEQLVLFAHDCQRNGVSVMDRLIHFTLNKNKDGSYTYTPITSIDFLRSRAADSGELAGISDAAFEGTPMQKGFVARVTVSRFVKNQICTFTASARWEEYYPGEAKGFMWRKMPFVMLGKCAEALALRKAFPRQLAGLYTNDEMQQADIEAPKYATYTEVAPVALTSDIPQIDISNIPEHPSMAFYAQPEKAEPTFAEICKEALGDDWKDKLKNLAVFLTEKEDVEWKALDAQTKAEIEKIVRKKHAGDFLNEEQAQAYMEGVKSLLKTGLPF